MSLITRRDTLGAGALAAAIALGPARADAATLDAALDAYLAPYVAARDFSGVVLIKRAGRTLARRAHGFADRDGRRRIGLRNKFSIGSIGKTLTLATLYRLEEAGALSISDTLARWMPDFPRAEAVTLDLLARHRSGLARDLTNFETARMQPRTLAQLMPLVIADGYVAETDVRTLYSNNGYRVLGRVIELASGASYHDAVDRLVLAPFGMHDTVAAFGPVHARNLAEGALVGDTPGALKAPLAVDLSNWQGAGSFCATVEDLARLATHFPLRAPQTPPPARTASGHDGLGHGYMACAYRFADSDTVIAMAGNIESGIFTPLQNDLEKIAFGETPAAPRPPAEIAMDAAAFARFAGKYSIGPGREMDVAIVDGRLAVNAGDGFTALWATGPSQFFSRLRYANLTFVEENGAIARIDWAEGGGVFPCPRVG
jgi:CubicO group peptidase (beta-lactamase class C family)